MDAENEQTKRNEIVKEYTESGMLNIPVEQDKLHLLHHLILRSFAK